MGKPFRYRQTETHYYPQEAISLYLSLLMVIPQFNMAMITTKIIYISQLKSGGDKKLTIAANGAITTTGSKLTSSSDVILSSGGNMRFESAQNFCD
nr:hemagglutinin repeat-containing protein [Photorhabdus heterorhabditis]